MTIDESARSDAELGFLDRQQWPREIRACVVSGSPERRIHGYDVETDLAQHYDFVSTALLAAAGEIPTDAQAQALGIALVFMAPAPVAEAPAHAAMVARLIGATPSAIAGVACTTLAEQARRLVDVHADLARWLDGVTTDPPAHYLARDELDRASVANLRQALGARGIEVPALRHPLNFDAALFALLRFCGLKRPWQVVAFWVMAKMPCALAEAMACKPRSFLSYPMDLPAYRYEEDK